jgi:hypothetical protein
MLFIFVGKLGKLKEIDFAWGSSNKKKMKSWLRWREWILWGWRRKEHMLETFMVEEQREINEWRSGRWQGLGVAALSYFIAFL